MDCKFRNSSVGKPVYFWHSPCMDLQWIRWSRYYYFAKHFKVFYLKICGDEGLEWQPDGDHDDSDYRDTHLITELIIQMKTIVRTVAVTITINQQELL